MTIVSLYLDFCATKSSFIHRSHQLNSILIHVTLTAIVHMFDSAILRSLSKVVLQLRSCLYKFPLSFYCRPISKVAENVSCNIGDVLSVSNFHFLKLFVHVVILGEYTGLQ
jgi:hypothetical protein